jgi:hypothetical protein
MRRARSASLFVLQDRDNPVWSGGAGLRAFGDVEAALSSEQAMRDRERILSEQRVQRINLHLALGGGFAAPPVVPAP